MDLISARSKRPRLGNEGLTALARWDFDILISASDHKAWLVNSAIEIAGGNQELHWLLAGVITARAGQGHVSPRQELAPRQQPLHKGDPKASISNFALFLASFTEGPAPQATGVQAQGLALPIALIRHQNGPVLVCRRRKHDRKRLLAQSDTDLIQRRQPLKQLFKRASRTQVENGIIPPRLRGSHFDCRRDAIAPSQGL